MSRAPDEHSAFEGDPSNAGQAGVRHYYVDEAGDPVLFNAKGRVIVGDEGCSRFFILGKLDVVDPNTVATAVSELRQHLLGDPYFKDVPSMQPERRKTARMFHAKDDVPEVRREVFKLLGSLDVRFYAVIRDKRVIAQKVLAYNKEKPNYRYNPNQLYDRCVPLLFQERLHQHEAYRIVFAKRGSKDRTQAFENGLLQAKERFRQKRHIEGTSPIEVVASDSARITCLQATDYFLWALQRCFERRERRFLDLLWPKVGLIIDRDDTQSKGTGEYYHRKQPLPVDFREGDAIGGGDGRA
ncbi:MAG TPA: DUF3800 domain-containing protein [Phycisphaerae bacterium]|nr:DUF3800 domain-containing protein [Phycisphaerae bacterium]